MLARYVHALASCKMIAAPGNRFAYSNIGYNVLSYLIARISGKSFEEYMKKQILLPAAMPDSTFFFPEVSPDRLAVPHLRTPTMIVNPVYPYHRADAAASFLHSTVIDMCHWAITCLDGGILNGQHVLSQASYDLMWLPVVERGYTPLYENNGLGWVLGHFDGLRTVSHGGGGFGWTDLLVMLTNCPVHARDCLNSPQERSRDMRSLCLISARVTASSTNRWTNGSFLPCNGLSNNCHK